MPAVFLCASRGFETGSSFDPVTSGVDVAAKRLPGGGALVLADCGALRGQVMTGDDWWRDQPISTSQRAPELGDELRCLRPASSRPELMLLVNGARFDLGAEGEAVARRLLQPPEGAGRSCARSAIAAAFGAELRELRVVNHGE
eukprot:Skav220105  [mRNA]  locus=scaffold1727:6647:10751:+ [translate_table: standard]